VNIVDSKGCTATANTTITQPTLLTSAIINPVNVTCSGLCNGSGAVSPSGGTPPYAYSWSNLVTTATNTNLCAGTYTSTVTDNNGCVTTATLTVNTPSPITITASSTNATCNNVCDGTATSTFSGGTAPYSFIWQPSLSTAFNAAGLCDGTHTVTITDANGCTQSATAVVTEPSALTTTVTVNSNSFCGQANGTAQVFVAGGTPNYSYSWSNGATSAFISGLVSGPYSIIVTDGNNCTANDVATIIDIAGPVLTLNASTDISCYGLNDGAATVTVSGGTPPFASQTWLLPGSLSPNPIQTGNGVHSDLWPGINVFNVVDAAGCVASINIPINEPTQLVSATNNTTNVTCNGLSNGSSTMLVNGGTPLYTYAWSDASAQTTPTALNLAAGTYTCNVTDANGCATSQTVTITQPLPLVIVNNSVVNIDCYGANNGSINVTPNGGTPAYTYSWSPNAGSGPVVTGLTPGVYQLQVTDTKGCTQNSAYNITQPDSFTVVITPVSSTCSNANASIALTVTGATAPYGYNWNSSPSQSTATATNLNAPATYACVITDANGCTKTVSSLVNDLPPPSIDSITVTNLICNGVPTGSATVWPKPGGAPIVTYAWTQGVTPVGSATTATGLSAGIYTITLVDGNGCLVTGVTALTEPFPLALSVSPAQTACNGEILGVFASAAGGTPTYTYTWSGAGAGLTGGGNHNVTFTNTTSSPVIQTFSVSVDDANGCGPVPTQFSVTVLPKITPVAPPVQGCEASVATLNGSASGGNSGPYTFTWTTTPSVTQSGFTSTVTTTVAATAVTYSLTVDDGCSTPESIPVIVSPLPVPNASFTSNTTAGCAGFPVTFLGSAGSGFSGSTYSWIFEDGTITPPTTVDTIVHTFNSSLPQTDTLTVQLVVTTTQGCRDTFTINNYITVYPDPVAEFTYGPETVTEFDPLVNFYDASILGATYAWNFDDSLSTSNTSILQNPSHIYQNPGYYDVVLTVASSHGCVDSVIHQVYVEPEFAIYVPNAFSPNDDSRNEVFLPQGICIDEDRYHLYIFDRWGEVIFESDKLSKGWDGKTKRSDAFVQQDVYIYKIIAYDLKNSKHSFTGHVTVVR
jgi:gliding motility-associated-like protein